MKLYEVPRNTWVIVSGHEDKPILFHHIDGMYSLCTDKEGNILHLGASTPVQLLNP